MAEVSGLTSILSGAQAYYPLENVNDSKNSYHLTNNNSVTFPTGKYSNGAYGGAANTNKYLSVSSNLGIAGNGDLTVSFWAKLGAEIGSGVWDFWEFNSTTGADRYCFMYYEYNGGTRRIIFDAAGGTTATYNITLGTSAYYHIVGTRNVSGNAIKLYVNNVEVASGTVGTGTTFGAANSFGLLASATGVNPMSALIDDVLVHPTVLTAGNVGTIFTDSIAYTKNLTETFTMSDVLKGKAITKAFTETPLITDSLTKSYNRFKSFSDISSISDKILGRRRKGSLFSRNSPSQGNDWTRRT